MKMSKKKIMKKKNNKNYVKKEILINISIIKFFAYCFIFPIILPKITNIFYISFIVDFILTIILYLKNDLSNLWRNDEKD